MKRNLMPSALAKGPMFMTRAAIITATGLTRVDFDGFVASGILPPPMLVGRKSYWRKDDILAAIWPSASNQNLPKGRRVALAITRMRGAK